MTIPRHISLLVLLCGTILVAQVRDGKPVSILASVTDSRDRFVDNLRQQDFELREDGKEQSITAFKTFRNTASSVGVLVDVSGSMKSRLNSTINAIDDFAGDLYKDDELFLMPFAETPRIASDYGDGRSEFHRELWKLTPSGNPALYDSVIEAVRKLQMGRESRRVLLIVSHGGDLVSAASPAVAIRTIRESDVLVYCLGIPPSIGSPFDGVSNYSSGQISLPQGGRSPQTPLPFPRTIPIPVPGGGPPRPVPVPLPGSADRVEDTMDMDALRALAQAGVGLAWRIRDRSGLCEPIDRVLSQIRSELHSQYAIGFTPNHPLKDNQWHDVTIRVKEPGYRVDSRSEYLGK
jgi:VWFA-related protein